MTKKKIKRRVSEILVPVNDDGAKDFMQSFRCSGELKELLDLEGNKSEFIQNALLRAFSKKKQVTCPLCKGKGKIGK